MSDTTVNLATSTAEGMRLFQQEKLILDVTELMFECMERQNIKRTQLAKALNFKSRSRVTQILDGDENLTLKTVADVFSAMGCMLTVSAEPIRIENERCSFITNCFRGEIRTTHWNFIAPNDADSDCLETLAG